MHRRSPKHQPAMASSVIPAVFMLFFLGGATAQLSKNFYSKSCPGVFDAVKPVVQSAISDEKRIGASIIRLFFHDCFVQVFLHRLVRGYPGSLKLFSHLRDYFSRVAMDQYSSTTLEILPGRRRRDPTTTPSEDSPS